ncbi:MAG: lipocalin-like domain-containing protein [Paracoccaceae bacterium]|nr:lipocalin-like domain-containing protein [Paracoccaceae bacterium]
MSVRAVFAALAIWLTATQAVAQGFAGLGQTTEGYALPDPATRFTYPADHGSHPEFRIEWWYVTANLQDADGTPYGIQWTLFRNAIRPGGAEADQGWMAHAALSSPGGHYYAERFARGASGQAGVMAEPFEAFIDEWQMAGPDLKTIRLTAQGTEFHYDLQLNADRPFVPQGEGGFSVKSEAGQASHYYSQPFYRVTGTLTLPDGAVEVTGQAWLDREWSSQPLTETQTGWDWISLHLNGGDKLMGYRLRDRDGSAYTVGTWINADGTPEPLAPGQLTMNATDWADVADRQVPVGWDVTLAEQALEINVDAVYPQSWMGTLIPYWEGPVRVTGSHEGVGYLEMSGY